MSKHPPVVHDLARVVAGSEIVSSSIKRICLERDGYAVVKSVYRDKVFCVDHSVQKSSAKIKRSSATSSSTLGGALDAKYPFLRRDLHGGHWNALDEPGKHRFIVKYPSGKDNCTQLQKTTMYVMREAKIMLHLQHFWVTKRTRCIERARACLDCKTLDENAIAELESIRTELAELQAYPFVQLYGLVENKDGLVVGLIMEKLQCNMTSFLKSLISNASLNLTQSTTMNTLVEYAHQLANVVSTLHDCHVAHMDLKYRNVGVGTLSFTHCSTSLDAYVFKTEDGSHERTRCNRLKLIDFQSSVVCTSGVDVLTEEHATHMFGASAAHALLIDNTPHTVNYVGPEIALDSMRQQKTIHPQSVDVYAVGLMCLAMCLQSPSLNFGEYDSPADQVASMQRMNCLTGGDVTRVDWYRTSDTVNGIDDFDPVMIGLANKPAEEVRKLLDDKYRYRSPKSCPIHPSKDKASLKKVDLDKPENGADASLDSDASSVSSTPDDKDNVTAIAASDKAKFVLSESGINTFLMRSSASGTGNILSKACFHRLFERHDVDIENQLFSGLFEGEDDSSTSSSSDSAMDVDDTSELARYKEPRTPLNSRFDLGLYYALWTERVDESWAYRSPAIDNMHPLVELIHFANSCHLYGINPLPVLLAEDPTLERDTLTRQSLNPILYDTATMFIKDLGFLVLNGLRHVLWRQCSSTYAAVPATPSAMRLVRYVTAMRVGLQGKSPGVGRDLVLPDGDDFSAVAQAAIKALDEASATWFTAGTRSILQDEDEVEEAHMWHMNWVLSLRDIEDNFSSNGWIAYLSNVRDVLRIFKTAVEIEPSDDNVLHQLVDPVYVDRHVFAESFNSLLERVSRMVALAPAQRYISSRYPADPNIGKLGRAPGTNCLDTAVLDLHASRLVPDHGLLATIPSPTEGDALVTLINLVTRVFGEFDMDDYAALTSTTVVGTQLNVRRRIFEHFAAPASHDVGRSNFWGLFKRFQATSILNVHGDAMVVNGMSTTWLRAFEAWRVARPAYYAGVTTNTAPEALSAMSVTNGGPKLRPAGARDAVYLYERLMDVLLLVTLFTHVNGVHGLGRTLVESTNQLAWILVSVLYESDDRLPAIDWRACSPLAGHLLCLALCKPHRESAPSAAAASYMWNPSVLKVRLHQTSADEDAASVLSPVNWLSEFELTRACHTESGEDCFGHKMPLFRALRAVKVDIESGSDGSEDEDHDSDGTLDPDDFESASDVDDCTESCSSSSDGSNGTKARNRPAQYNTADMAVDTQWNGHLIHKQRPAGKFGHVRGDLLRGDQTAVAKFIWARDCPREHAEMLAADGKELVVCNFPTLLNLFALSPALVDMVAQSNVCTPLPVYIASVPRLFTWLSYSNSASLTFETGARRLAWFHKTLALANCTLRDLETVSTVWLLAAIAMYRVYTDGDEPIDAASVSSLDRQTVRTDSAWLVDMMARVASFSPTDASFAPETDTRLRIEIMVAQMSEAQICDTSQRLVALVADLDPSMTISSDCPCFV